LLGEVREMATEAFAWNVFGQPVAALPQPEARRCGPGLLQPACGTHMHRCCWAAAAAKPLTPAEKYNIITRHLQEYTKDEVLRQVGLPLAA
jgi:hypothetical protein